MSSTRVLYALLGLVTALGLLTVGHEAGKKEGRREAEIAQSTPQVPSEWSKGGEISPRVMTEPVDRVAQDELPSQQDQDRPTRGQRTYSPRRAEPSAEDCKAAFDNFFAKNPGETKPFEIIQLHLTQAYVADEPLIGTVLTVHFEAEVEYLEKHSGGKPLSLIPLTYELPPGEMGERHSIRGKIGFQKTDRGWLGIDEELY